MGVFQEVEQKVAEARAVNFAVDMQVREMVKLLKGRLRAAYSGSQYYSDTAALCALKRELRSFNMTTGTWKD